MVWCQNWILRLQLFLWAESVDMSWWRQKICRIQGYEVMVPYFDALAGNEVSGRHAPEPYSSTCRSGKPFRLYESHECEPGDWLQKSMPLNINYKGNPWSDWDCDVPECVCLVWDAWEPGRCMLENGMGKDAEPADPGHGFANEASRIPGEPYCMYTKEMNT